ncbi:MAG: DsrE family protein [Burkholderiaceae bacterium]|jgi:predicted peroxiredoxin|nr:DsrE family protein [Burkholderiaceae bacterium]
MSFIERAAQGLAILLWAADDRAPERLATPFFHAAAAAAMDAQVEIYFSARSVRLLLPSVAASLKASDRVQQTIFDHMRQARDLGVRFLACSDALHAQGIDNASLIPECDGHAGATAYIARALDPQWRVLVF